MVRSASKSRRSTIWVTAGNCCVSKYVLPCFSGIKSNRFWIESLFVMESGFCGITEKDQTVGWCRQTPRHFSRINDQTPSVTTVKSFNSQFFYFVKTCKVWFERSSEGQVKVKKRKRLARKLRNHELKMTRYVNSGSPYTNISRKPYKNRVILHYAPRNLRFTICDGFVAIKITKIGFRLRTHMTCSLPGLLIFPSPPPRSGCLLNLKAQKGKSKAVALGNLFRFHHFASHILPGRDKRCVFISVCVFLCFCVLASSL